MDRITVWPGDNDLAAVPPLPLADSHAQLTTNNNNPSMSSTTAALSHQKSCPGNLSLHEYRKHLSQPAPPSPGADAMAGRRVRRKNGAANLTQQLASASASALAGSSVSVSSATSGLSLTPPPLSPSYSPSAMSLASETEAASVLEGPRAGLRGGKMVSPVSSLRFVHPYSTQANR
jgi:hypothetical protein